MLTKSSAKLARFIAGRIVTMIVVLLIIAAITFFTFTLLPTDVTTLACGRPCTPERMAEVRSLMGYDLPVWQQFLNFLGGIFAGRTYGEGPAAVTCSAPCFGYSFQRAETVNTLIVQALPVTASLAVGAVILALIIGMVAGTVSALKPRSFLDRVFMLFAITGVSAPAYLVGLLGILFFGFFLDIVPVSGYVPFTQDPIRWLWSLALPWATLAFISAATYARLTRTQMLEVMSEDFIRTARAKGLKASKVIGVHALRNVSLPIITVFGLELGSLLGGAVITEKVFSMPGLGSLMIDSVGMLDLPVLLGITVFSAFAVVIINMLVDIVYGILDPRTIK